MFLMSAQFILCMWQQFSLPNWGRSRKQLSVALTSTVSLLACIHLSSPVLHSHFEILEEGTIFLFYAMCSQSIVPSRWSALTPDK